MRQRNSRPIINREKSEIALRRTVLPRIQRGIEMPKHNVSDDRTVRAEESGSPRFFKMSLADKLAQSLVDDISRGVLRRGARLPTEADLCAMHGVSRITVRRALASLRSNGLIESIAGRGTFITGANNLGRWQLESVEDLVRFIADTHTARSKILRWDIVRPIVEARRFLGSLREKTYLMVAVRHQGRHPIYIVEAHIPLAIGRRITRDDLDAATPAELYETTLDMPPQRVVEEITAVPASLLCAEHLNLKVGEPVVLHTLGFHGPDGPLQYVREWWNPKFFRRRSELTRRL